MRFKQMLVYQKAYQQAMEIFRITQTFPREERYSLVDQIRRSSRSVCTNIAEAYMKRKYPAYFVSKISDSDSENAETSVWLDFSSNCDYLPGEKYQALLSNNLEVGRLIGDILKDPKKYL